jgi:F-type H+-transporting ATPase subunit b
MLDFSVTFIITLINIAILFLILRAILFKPVTAFMERRTEKIRSDMEQAEKDKAKALLLQRQYEEKLRDAEQEAGALIRDAKEQAARQSEQIVAEGRTQAEQLIVNARKQIDAERRAAMALFKAEAATLVVSASSRLLRRELDREESLRYADALLKEIGNA